ncbi:hypothetical protein QAD02_007713 [Eretmocerus hayati]|uniref:Uncharacterized protein n=1 Tax=Eretmocerus hayati TaxID=131215 RepID=A0ACC2N4P7_9HYME|nr:hypothetical protein QAD02_007713 [Eretmocerus hayati]
MYCEAIHILMSDEISHEALLKAHTLLNNFVVLTQILYGKRAMTFNVHQLTHLTQSVAYFGPLGEHNGYPFESGNGEILKTVHSGKGVINQICRNVNMGTSLQTIENGIQRHDFPPVQFCRSLKETETVKLLQVGGCRCFGEASVTPDWVLQGIDVADDQCGVYHRMCKQGCLYRSTRKVLESSDNSHKQLKDGSFIETSFFVSDRLNDKLYIAAKNINVHRIHDFTFLNKITDINGDLLLVDSAEIKKICSYPGAERQSIHHSCPDHDHVFMICTPTRNLGPNFL